MASAPCQTPRGQRGKNEQDTALRFSMAEEPRPKKRKTEVPATTLISLPPEVMVLICRYLTVKDKLCLRLVNKQAYSLLSDHVFWREIRLHEERLYHKSFVKLIFKICPESLKHLELPETIYCNNENIKKLSSKCKNIEKLSWPSSRVGNLSVLPSTSLTHLHLNMSCFGPLGGTNSLPCSIYENLKLLVISEYCHINIDWFATNYKPPLIAVVNATSTFKNVNVITKSTDTVPASGCVSIYARKKPSVLPFYEKPHSNFSIGSFSKIYAKVEGPDTYPLLVLDTAVNPDIFHPSSTYMFGTCTKHVPSSLSDTLPPTVPYATVCVEQLHCFNFPKHHFQYNFLETVLSRTPHLLQLNMSQCVLPPGMPLCDFLSILPSSCPHLKGLNIEGINHSINCNRKYLWHILSQIKCLEYLVIDESLLVALRTEMDKVVIDTTPVQASISEMTSLRALQVKSASSLSMSNAIKNSKLGIAPALACFKTLQYLYMYACELKPEMLECVLENVPSLHTLCIESFRVSLPNRPELFAKLDNLAITTSTLPLSAIMHNSCQLKRFGLSALNLWPSTTILDILNGMPNLHTCIICCRIPRHYRRYHSIREAKRLAQDKNVNLKCDFDTRNTFFNDGDLDGLCLYY